MSCVEIQTQHLSNTNLKQAQYITYLDSCLTWKTWNDTIHFKRM